MSALNPAPRWPIGQYKSLLDRCLPHVACRDGPYQPLVGVPPPGGGGLDGAAPPQGPGAFQPGVAGPSWFTVMILIGVSVTTLAGGFVLFILYLRPVLKAAERAAAAAEAAAKQMEVAAQVRTLQGLAGGLGAGRHAVSMVSSMSPTASVRCW